MRLPHILLITPTQNTSKYPPSLAAANLLCSVSSIERMNSWYKSSAKCLDVATCLHIDLYLLSDMISVNTAFNLCILEKPPPYGAGVKPNNNEQQTFQKYTTILLFIHIQLNSFCLIFSTLPNFNKINLAVC